MVAHVNRYDWRTNLGVTINGKRVIQEPREGVIIRINWWNYSTGSESGDIIASNDVALVEGPLPDGEDGTALGGAVTALRDVDDINVLLLTSPGTGLSTNNDASRFRHPHFVFPGGIWTVNDVWAFATSDGGVDRFKCSIGFELIKISKSEWIRFRNASPNLSTAGELIQ